MSRYKRKRVTLVAMFGVLLAFAAIYLMVGMHFDKPKLLQYALSIRIPKLLAMLIVGFALGSSSVVFQSVINNRIVTPCLLGMDQLYTLIHTAVFFSLGAASIFVTNSIAAFALDIVLMGIVATVIYSYLFKKTGHNILYVLLIGTVLTGLFGSIQTTMTRMMEPNEYNSLLNRLIASFSNVSDSIIAVSLLLLLVVIAVLYKDLKLLNVLTLGKDSAINLGVDYDKSIRRLLLGVVLYMTIATALVGPLAFLGLITANLSRQIFSTYRHTYLIAGSALVGMIVLIAGQTLVEHVFAFGVPVSVFVTIGGGIYFLILLLKGQKA